MPKRGLFGEKKVSFDFAVALYIGIVHWLTMVAILQLKASKLIVYFVSFTVVIFTILNIVLY